ncbi:hypothetical protein NAT51_13355 [Flavobacterium amniphilum]|uniref:hypothetical protein n=1 Tax=Flavobacterium amniphilum TaxID=1834035 RepID=UPI00202AA0AB|nr:hypothetical protein [Flavobacterium amniphilum]MCL9806517.1 hypothetical protein [Flavobacterium amniphilum]
MIKKIILGSLFLFSLQTFAQEGTASPYSFYGIGEVKSKGTTENRAMGSLGIVSDSIHINLQNPATFSDLKLTTFTVAGTFTPTKQITTEEEQKAQRTTFDYLAMSFPVSKKMGVVLGLMPYSSVGYKIVNYTDTEGTKFTGSGNVNRFFTGFGYQLTKNLSFGADLAYNFGSSDKSAVFISSDLQFGTREINLAEMNGLTYKAGLNFKSKIKKFDFTTALTFSPTSILKSDNTRNIAKITYTPSGDEIVWDSQDVVIPNSEIRLPSRLTLGTGLGLDKKWFLGVESTFSSKGNYGVNYPNASYESSSKIALGGYYIPKYNSFSSYFDRITYRAGVRYENTGLVVNSESIKDRAVTFGFGLPISGSLSNVNIGVELGKRGTTDSGLIQENYMSFSVGLSFNDRWFVKRKFD